MGGGSSKSAPPAQKGKAPSRPGSSKNVKAAAPSKAAPAPKGKGKAAGGGKGGKGGGDAKEKNDMDIVERPCAGDTRASSSCSSCPDDEE